MKQLMKKLFTLFLTLFLTKSFAQTVVTIGGGVSISCPNVPTATWTTPPSGVSFSNWSRGSGVGCVSASDGLSGNGFNTASFNASFTANKFYRFTITTNSTTSARVTNFNWLTTVSSGSCNFTLAYQNNGGTLTQFGVTGNHPTNNNFTGTVTIAPSTSCVFYLIPHGTNSSSRTVKWMNSSTITLSAPNISTSGSLSAMTTIYGTASTSRSFTVSGTNMISGITVTPPVGLEVSTSSTFTTVGTNSSPIVVGGSGTISSTTIFVRLSANAVPGTYNSRNISLVSTAATTRNVSTASSGNIVSVKPLTVSSPQVQSKIYDGTNSATITGTLNGIVGSDVVTFNGTGTFASSNAGSNISVTSTSTIGGTHANRYSLTQPTGLTGIISKDNQTITFDNFPYKSTFDLDFSPVASTSSNLTLTFTSSNPDVATIIGGKVRINGIGTTTITASQSGDINYNAATSVSKDLEVLSPVSRWSFEALSFSGTGQSPTVTNDLADIGDQTDNTSVGGFHNSSLTNWTTPVGNASAKSISASNWAQNDYFIFRVNSKYTTIIKLTFDQTSSSTGPRDFKLQWSINGVNFTDISNYTVPYNTTTNTPYSWSSTIYDSRSTLSFDLSSITEINDQPNVYFRLVNTTTNALNGGTVQSAGTSRMDNFTMFGSLDIPLSLDIISFSGKTFGQQNRLQWTLSEWGVVKIQKYISGTWEEVDKTENNFWFDNKPYKGLSYYRIVTNNTISNPIYISNPMGIEPSTSEFKYCDINGKKVSGTETNKIMIRKSEFNSEKIVIVE